MKKLWMESTIKLLIPLTLLFPSCAKESTEQAAPSERNYALFTHGSRPVTPQETTTTTTGKIISLPTKVKGQTEELDFEVENSTGKTIYLTCFTYIQKEHFVRWRWDKSAVYKLAPRQQVMVNIDTIPDDQNREQIFGYLAIFDTEQEAHDAIYELTNDANKIDLDQLHKLKDKKVVIGIEKYGFKKELLDFAIIEKFKKKRRPDELDFLVENRTGRTIYVTSFIYQAKDNIRSVWRFDKTAVLKLLPGQTSVINVDTIEDPRNQVYMSGFLAVFEEHEEQKAHDITYELLQPKNRLALGRLSQIKDKKVVIDIEQYGSIGEITEFDIQPATHLFNKDGNNNEKINLHVAAMIKNKESKSKSSSLHQRKNRKTYQFFT